MRFESQGKSLKKVDRQENDSEEKLDEIKMPPRREGIQK